MKIIFTSCVRYEAFKEQPEWAQILDQNPDYLFLLGDNIYMDYGIAPFSHEPIGCPENYSVQEFKSIMTKKYNNQFTLVPEFKNLVEKMKLKNGFFAIWDDHDFAWDNAKGATVSPEKKKISQELFHKYLNCSTNLPYTYYHVDTPFARVIFIDNRTDSEEKGKDAQLLSNEQFEFIENKLQHDLKYTILCGGLTLTEGHENWTNYPSQLKKLCEMIAKQNNVIFLCGDIHKNKFIKPKKIENLNITTPVQIISSGMQVNYLGLGIPHDDKHNWCMLELKEDNIQVSFYNKHGHQKKKSEKATMFLNSYL
ncbi:MAG TPA: hypothetical protein DIW37_04935 [Chryseobacterium sp.]|nr:hypothetical protein [Chryseobacterium sp.]